MRSALRDFAVLLLGAVIGVIGSQKPEFAPGLALVAFIFFLLYFLSGLPPLRRRVGFLRTQDDENEILRVLLGGHLRAGNALVSEVVTLTDQAERLADVKKRAGAWARVVLNDLEKHRPGWGDLFNDDTFGAQYMSQYGERDKIRNWLERRLAKLGDLVRQL